MPDIALTKKKATDSIKFVRITEHNYAKLKNSLFFIGLTDSFFFLNACEVVRGNDQRMRVAKAILFVYTYLIPTFSFVFFHTRELFHSRSGADVFSAVFLC